MSDEQLIALAEANGWRLVGSLWRQPDGSREWAGGIIILRRWLWQTEAHT